MNKYFVRVSDSDESMYILADNWHYNGEELEFIKNEKTIAVFKKWSYWMQVFE